MDRDTQRMRVDEGAGPDSTEIDRTQAGPSNESGAPADVTHVTNQPTVPAKGSEFTYATDPGKAGNTLRLIADGLRHSQERRDAATEAARIEAIRGSASGSAPVGAANPLDLPTSPSGDQELEVAPQESDEPGSPAPRRPTVPRGRVWLYSPAILVLIGACALLAGVVITAALLRNQPSASTVPNAAVHVNAAAATSSNVAAVAPPPPASAMALPTHPTQLAPLATVRPAASPATSAANIAPASATVPISPPTASSTMPVPSGLHGLPPELLP